MVVGKFYFPPKYLPLEYLGLDTNAQSSESAWTIANPNFISEARFVKLYFPRKLSAVGL